MFPDERGLFGVLSCTKPTKKSVSDQSAAAALHDGIWVIKSSQNRKFEKRRGMRVSRKS